MTVTLDRSEALQDQEVQAMLKRLAEFGLGISVPHAHDTTDVMVDLSRGQVQYEEDLTVSFVAEDDARLIGSVPVAWVWDGAPRVVGRCRQGHNS